MNTPAHGHLSTSTSSNCSTVEHLGEGQCKSVRMRVSSVPRDMGLKTVEQRLWKAGIQVQGRAEGEELV